MALVVGAVFGGASILVMNRKRKVNSEDSDEKGELVGR